MKLSSLLFSLFLILIVSCNELNPKGEKEIRDFVTQWNQKHTHLKSPYLESLYMDVVTYYNNERTRTEVQQDKSLLFQQFPDYTQRILYDELVITKEAGSYLVTFTKRVNYNGIEADYTSYLSLIYKNGTFKILREGVAKNSKNLDAPIFPDVRKNNVSTSKNARVYGDFNGDGLSDYASVISPDYQTGALLETKDNSEVICEGGCNSIITFSGIDLQNIIIEGAYQSQLENLKDLNSDGADEIGFWDIKPKSKTLYIFNAANANLLCTPIVINTTVHKNLNLIDVFKKSGPNKITVTRSIEVNGKWLLKSDVIELD